MASRVKAKFPRVIEIIKKLYNKGYNLCTASETELIELNFYFESMRINEFFKKLYYPDLINTLKVNNFKS